MNGCHPLPLWELATSRQARAGTPPSLFRQVGSATRSQDLLVVQLVDVYSRLVQTDYTGAETTSSQEVQVYALEARLDHDCSTQLCCHDID